MFFYFGIIKSKISFEYRRNIFNYVGFIFVFYALIVYPILGHLLGHQYPSSPTFGLPCPTTIFTFGILLFLQNRISIIALIIPLLWSVIGFSAALNLLIYEDFGLVVAGIMGFILILLQNKNEVNSKKTV